MSVHAFISYSHNDEKALDRLHKHLAMLRRDGKIDAWTDHRILPGDRFDSEIGVSLDASGLFLALLSPDYLASPYCYETEFQRALQLEKAGSLRIVPIVLEPCEWLQSPFREFMALPKDGKPVSEWTNQNNAYLDVVSGIRRVLDTAGSTAEGMDSSQGRPAGARRPRVKQDFDAIQKSDFADKAYDAIRRYFSDSCAELNQVGDGTLKARFEDMDHSAFTCTVVNRAKQRGGEAHITIRNTKRRNHFGDINFVHQPHADSDISNGSIKIEADDYNLFLKMDRFSGGGRDDAKLTPEQAAESLWNEFVERAGITYE